MDRVDDLIDIVNVPELTSRINQRLKNADQPEITQSQCCIYRTPKSLRKVNEAAYTPRLVSIGPYHYGNEDLKMMENVKERYLRNYLDRAQTTLEFNLRFIMECKERLKDYYAETTLSGYAETTLSGTSFLEIILLDRVFIIELFLQICCPNSAQRDKKIMLHSIDLISDLFFLLENQLPWFFIEELYTRVVYRHVPDRKSFLNLALKICSRHVHWGIPDDETSISVNGVKHLHDLLRTTIVHSLLWTYEPPAVTHFEPFEKHLSATLLYEAGVKFRRVRHSKSFLGILFCKGTLYMPSFIFDRNTETFVRNLMAYEQCHRHRKEFLFHDYLCDYFYLMDSLINTSKDVDLLVKSRIIINKLGNNDEVVTLINNLFKHVHIDLNSFYYAKLCRALDTHYENSWNEWNATFKRDYLSTPWKVASTIAAIILLLLTLIQTVCSLVSLFK